MDILQQLYKIQRYTPEQVAALSPALQEAWQILHAASMQQRAMYQEFKAMPKRSKDTKALWADHDKRASEVNEQLKDAIRFYMASMDA